ncbi:MAG: alpha/beta fold hydrolase, partial [Deltaproteobacteria bacterium]
EDELAALDALWRRWSPGWTPPAAEQAAVREALRRPGVLDAALGYYRALFSLWRRDSRRAIALLRTEIRVPTLVLYGDRDGCMDPELFPMAAARARVGGGAVELRRVPDAGHFLHQERPEEVNAALVGWLAAH